MRLGDGESAAEGNAPPLASTHHSIIRSSDLAADLLLGCFWLIDCCVSGDFICISDYASIKGQFAMDAEATKELALLEQLKKDQTTRQQKTFSGWLNKVQKRSGGLISDEDLKHEREMEAKQKKDKKDWEYVSCAIALHCCAVLLMCCCIAGVGRY